MSRRARALLAVLILTASVAHEAAAAAPASPDSSVFAEDSLIIKLPPKRWDIVVLEIAVIHAIPWAVGHYIMDGYWTQISTETIDINLRHGFEWDENMFKNNFSSHPYHGSTYFNAARTNGMNFWESAPYAFVGSLTWELFMESEFPSKSDLVMTTMGGISLGETLYRLSEQLLDDRTTGNERFWRELGGAALNPVGGFNRLFRGDMFQRYDKANHLRNAFGGYLALGTSTNIDTGIDDEKIRAAVELTLGYGNPFDDRPARRPFDYFTLRMWLSVGPEKVNMATLQHAFLVGKGFGAGDAGEVRHVAGLFQHYDYVNVDLFNYGGLSVAPGIVSRWSLGESWKLTTGAYAGWLMMGGSNNEYFTTPQGGNYNYTTGVKAEADIRLGHDRYGDLLALYMYFYMTSLHGTEGDDRIDQLSLVYNKKLYQGLGLGLEGFLYHRVGDYTGFAESDVTVKGARLLLSYGFY